MDSFYKELSKSADAFLLDGDSKLSIWEIANPLVGIYYMILNGKSFKQRPNKKAALLEYEALKRKN